MIYVFWNGEFYYTCSENHWKHGNPVRTCYCQEDADKEARILNLKHFGERA